MTAVINDISALPVGRAPEPLPAPHFPDALHAVVWRNWDVVDATLLAGVLKGTVAQIAAVATSMGLPAQRKILPVELRRNYATILRRNWHLLPYEQICAILGWDAATMQFTLNEDDFLWVKLGGFKPKCAPVYYAEPDANSKAAAAEISRVMKHEMGDLLGAPSEPLFGFIDRFNKAGTNVKAPDAGQFEYRVVYPYFLRYGDPLTGEGINDTPDGYLAELAASGVNAIWIQAVLNSLYPWDVAPELSRGWQERIANLKKLVERCRTFGIDVILYLNEPRAMRRAFYEAHPELRGVEETPDRAPYSPDVVALCTSTPAVQEFLVNSVKHVFEQVPDLGGIVAITYSENLTNCYSRLYNDQVDGFALRSTETLDATPDKLGAKPCPRCEPRGPEVVNAEVCTLLERGMRLAGSKGKFILYVWSTPEEWVPGIIDRLPASTYVQCISEWGLTFTRGDYTGKVNEYSMSVIGPSEQSKRQWAYARKRGLKTAGKMQVVNTYEYSSIPYIPVLRRVAEHLQQVTAENVNGLMLGWTAGGSPSPNLELMAEFSKTPRPTIAEAVNAVATRHFGAHASVVAQAWEHFSRAYEEFPFDLAVCYNGPQSHGPSNLLYATPTGYMASMCTYAHDDLDGWRGPYSAETFQGQFEKMEQLWLPGVKILEALYKQHPSPALADEWRVAEASWIHFRSTANQAKFIRNRQTNVAFAREILKEEIELSRRLFELVTQDSRIGFEATNHYGYIRYDLAEKILNCTDLLKRMA